MYKGIFLFYFCNFLYIKKSSYGCKAKKPKIACNSKTTPIFKKKNNIYLHYSNAKLKFAQTLLKHFVSIYKFSLLKNRLKVNEEKFQTRK
jgi:hypothetical protein